MLAQIPMKEFGQAEQVADLTVFLAGQDYLTGQVVAIDGGLSSVAEARGEKDETKSRSSNRLWSNISNRKYTRRILE